MNNGVHIGAAFIDGEMHVYFRRRFSFAVDMYAIRRNLHKIPSFDKSFVDRCGRYQNISVRKARTDVAISGSHKPLRLDAMADFDEWLDDAIKISVGHYVMPKTPPSLKTKKLRVLDNPKSAARAKTQSDKLIPNWSLCALAASRETIFQTPQII
jgi:hypothetical protein